MESMPTPEELDLGRCSTDGSFEAMNSPIMKLSIIYSMVLIFLTFWYSYQAIMLLIHRNIYSNCSRMLLIFNLINSNVWQTNYLIIRVRDLYQILKFSEDRCKIEFHYPECSFQQIINYYGILLAVFCVFSLTCDRFLAFFLTKFYAKHQKTIPIVMMVIFSIISLILYLWGFYGVPQAGYVPTCYYPPFLSLERFNILSASLFYFMIFNFFLSLFILTLNMIKDKKLHHSNFNTSTRYISFENLETTKAIFSINMSQVFFLSFTSVAYMATQFYVEEIPEKLFHLTVPFTTAILYGNLSIPALICYQTKKCISRRKKTIGKMTKVSDDMDTRMSGLRKMWN